MLTRMAQSLARQSQCQCVHVGSSIELRTDGRLRARLWLYQYAGASTAIFEAYDPALRTIAGDCVAAFNRAMRSHYAASADG